MTLYTRDVRGRGRAAAFGAAALIAAGTLLAPASPAAAAEPHHVFTPTFLAYTDAAGPTVYWPSGGDIPVGSWNDEEGGKHTSRIYVSFPIGGIARVRLHTATLVADESRANDCAKPRSVTAQATAEFVPEVNSWANPPATTGKTAVATVGDTWCTTRTRWDLTAAVDTAIRRGEHTIHLELKVNKANEGKVPFGRWLMANEFKFEVDLTNTPPQQPTGLNNGNENYGCAGDFVARENITAYADLADRDRDPGDLLTAQYEFWPAADPAAVTPMDHSIASGGATGVLGVGYVPVSTLPDGEYAWHVRAYDQRDYGPWSDACRFTVDRTVPSAEPTVASPEYPENPPQPTGSSSLPGTFLFTANGVPDVVEFFYGESRWNMWNRVPADQVGGAATIQWRPNDDGPQSLFVASADKAGNRSPVREYKYWVRNPQVMFWTTGQTPDPSGSGILTTLHFSTQAGNGISTVTYRVNGGAEQSAAVGADGVAESQTGPLRAGEYAIVFQGRNASGAVQYELETTFGVYDFPVVTSDGVYPVGGTGGKPGVTGVFTVTPQLTGAIRVHFNSTSLTEPITVPIDADGKARVSWTPTKAGWHYFWFAVEYADGTKSSYLSFNTTVAN
ncbi:hypothetical protein AB0B31_24635 [Catellatospora citrea]|uniref:hypothetical protein n=1 Tax=Catellatospora citrea TaxID=53366 RepID=UPI0033E4530C